MPASAEEKHCFVLMPFREDLRRVYERVFKPVCEANAIRCWRVDELFQPGTITDDIIKGIIESDVIIADITDQNANVFYELGIAHATGNKTILVAQSLDSAPFDVSAYRIIRYKDTTAGLRQLTTDLDRAIKSVLANSVGNNPVYALVSRNPHSRMPVAQEEPATGNRRGRRSIAGTWRGTALDAVIPGILEYKTVLQYGIVCELRHHGDRILGDVQVIADIAYGLTVDGRFEDSKYLFAEYHNSNPNTTDRGYAILELSGTGDELSGILIGPGMREPTVAVVSVKLTRDRS